MTDLSDEFQKYRKEDPETVSDEKKDIVHHERQGTVRTISFIQSDRKELFLNYAYLMYGDYNPEGKIISLGFTTHEIVLQGHNLSSLKEGLKAQTVKEVRAVDERYAQTKEEKEAVVTVMTIKER